jgi:SAM-dependent methyltransferase
MEPIDADRRFQFIYEHDVWEGGSGPGSLPSGTLAYRSFVEFFIQENKIRTVTDLGCGDWQFARYMDWSSTHYVGIDVVPELVERNKSLFGRDNVEFRLASGPNDLPGGDLVLCKEVLQHLPNAYVQIYIDHMRAKYKYCLITNSVGPTAGLNSDIQMGEFRPLRIDPPPFNANGAYVLNYFPCKVDDSWMMKNSVFLIIGHR